MTLAFDLKRPCKHCPFRTDGTPFLDRRAREIADAITVEDKTFSCHKTNVWDEDDEGRAYVSEEPQHCAGAAIMLEHMDNPNQWMRWMERIRRYDRTTMDMEAPVFTDAEEFVRFHTHKNRMENDDGTER